MIIGLIVVVTNRRNMILYYIMRDSIFKGKKILFICRETYCKPLWFLAEKLKEDNEVAAFFIMSSECSYSKTYYNEYTYYQFKKLENDIKIYDVKDICEQFIEGLSSSKEPMDMEYLKMIDKEYSHFKNLNMQLMSSQMNTRHYHYRMYWKVTSYAENLYWLELNYKKIIGILDEFKPDMIFDMDNAELQRTILAEVAYKKQIPCMTIEYSKYGYYKYPSFQNAFGIDPYIRNMFNELDKASDEEVKEGIEYVENYRKENSIMNKEFAGSVTSKYERDSLIWIARVMHGKLEYFYDMDIRKHNLKLKKKSKMLYAPSLPYIRYYLEEELKKRYLYGKNKYFENPVEGEDYVYMPLHLIPESSVFVKASYYVDECNLIEQVSKSLPIGWKLYVKEHQAMLGERGFSFYKKVAQLHNVRVVQVNYYTDPKPWIMNAKGVITITGTAAYEAALLGKKSIVFGEVPFSMIKGITRITSFDQLPEAIRSFGDVDSLHSAAAYIETVKRAGSPVKIFELMDGADDVFAGKRERDDNWEEMLNELLDFYEKGYKRYEQAKEKGYFIVDEPIKQ